MKKRASTRTHGGAVCNLYQVCGHKRGRGNVTLAQFESRTYRLSCPQVGTVGTHERYVPLPQGPDASRRWTGQAKMRENETGGERVQVNKYVLVVDTASPLLTRGLLCIVLYALFAQSFHTQCDLASCVLLPEQREELGPSPICCDVRLAQSEATQQSCFRVVCSYVRRYFQYRRTVCTLDEQEARERREAKHECLTIHTWPAYIVKFE